MEQITEMAVAGKRIETPFPISNQLPIRLNTEKSANVIATCPRRTSACLAGVTAVMGGANSTARCGALSVHSGDEV